MKENVILKSLYASLSLALSWLLIGLVSYGFVGKAVETIIVWRRTNRLEGYYRSIGLYNKDWEGKNVPTRKGSPHRAKPCLRVRGCTKENRRFHAGYLQYRFRFGTMDVPATLYAESI